MMKYAQQLLHQVHQLLSVCLPCGATGRLHRVSLSALRDNKVMISPFRQCQVGFLMFGLVFKSKVKHLACFTLRLTTILVYFTSCIYLVSERGRERLSSPDEFCLCPIIPASVHLLVSTG